MRDALEILGVAVVMLLLVWVLEPIFDAVVERVRQWRIRRWFQGTRG